MLTAQLSSRRLPLILIALIGLLFLIVLFRFLLPSAAPTTFAPVPNALDTPEAAAQRETCRKKVAAITEKDRTMFNQFRSLTDFKVFKYAECLEENGLSE